MKRHNSLISIGEVADNPRPRIKPKLRRQNVNRGIRAEIHKPLRTIRPESKWLDIYTASAPLPFGGWQNTGFLFNGLAIGGSPTQRLGRKVNFTKMNIRYSFWMDQTISPPTSGCNVRIVVIYDKQANAVQAPQGEIFQANDFNSMLLLDNRDRFITLADVITDPISLGGPYVCTGTIFRKFNLETIYNASGAGTIADINTGAIIMYYAINNTNAGLTVSASIRSRLRFVDF